MTKFHAIIESYGCWISWSLILVKLDVAGQACKWHLRLQVDQIHQVFNDKISDDEDDPQNIHGATKISCLTLEHAFKKKVGKFVMFFLYLKSDSKQW